ncbi:uncharacterized protein LOC126831496 isoform X2 [Patella vulgata]|uniref:uncharacterized protein LOC126831496 isoform X2 n=1 Tax=Patella vulgata TaxID=6465 RepID=UPI00217F45F7|nr:uncharacterized protein LOC126831496 isoform X2 [Patella vulgata]
MSAKRDVRNLVNQPKNSRGNTPVSEKVKEIKKRQENWMKQRADHITQDDFVIKENNLDVKQSTGIKDKFKHWLKKQSNEQDFDTLSQLTQSEHFKGSASELDGYGDESTYDYEDDEEEEDVDIDKLKEKLLSTKDFDAKADSIVEKVRKDLNLYSKDIDRIPNRSRSCFESRGQKSNNFSNHHCPSCSLSMVTVENTPMLMIPCGHSVCRVCCEGRKLCVVCDCRITSVTSNIMLQQIIHEYSQRQPAVARHQSAKVQSHYSSHKYDDSPPYNITSPDNSTLNKRKYHEQLNNLQTRIDIMSSEQHSLQEDINVIQTKLTTEERQKRNIQKQKENIESKISDLREKLKLLTIHEDEYNEKCDILIEEKDVLTEKLSLLNNTLTSLNQEVEKILFLVEADDV